MRTSEYAKSKRPGVHYWHVFVLSIILLICGGLILWGMLGLPGTTGRITEAYQAWVGYGAAAVALGFGALTMGTSFIHPLRSSPKWTNYAGSIFGIVTAAGLLAMMRGILLYAPLYVGQ
jgi:hypothetical protein